MRKYWLGLICVTALFLIYLSVWSRTSPWTEISTPGGIYSRILKAGNYIIYGTSNSRLYITSTNNDKKVKTLDFNTEPLIPKNLTGNNLYVISRGSLFKVDIKKPKVIWSFTGDGGFDFDRSEQYGSRVYITARDGSLYVVNSANGKLVWKFAGAEPSSLAGRVQDNVVYYSPDFLVKGSVVYLEDRSGTFYSLNTKNGKINWRRDFTEVLVSGITPYRNELIIFSASGLRTALNKKDGNIIWQKKDTSPAVCSAIYKPNLLFTNLIAATEAGEIVSFNLSTGDVLWKSEAFGSGMNCPNYFSPSGVFSLASGKIFKIDMRTGKTKWQYSGMGQTTLPPRIVKNLISESYVFADLNGDVWAIRSDQKPLWTFKTGYPIYAPLLMDNDLIYIATANGTIFKIKKDSGKPGFLYSFFARHQFTTNVSSQIVGGNEIFEITLHSKSTFTNPWSEADLSAIFTGPSGRNISVNGFYYDGADWKIRFNPPEKGWWNYKLNWTDHGVISIKEGSLFSRTDTLNSYLRVDALNPRRLTVDHKTIFNGVGIEESMLDYNGNGTPLDDWSTGSSDQYIATGSAGVTFNFRSNKPVTLTDYLNTYGPKGAGFNIYRYSILNNTEALYRSLETPITYSVQQGKTADELLTQLKANDIHIWFTFFNFDVPLKDTSSPTERALLTEYIKYVVARYGAYVDIWELVNEANLPVKLKSFLIEAIHKEDYESRLISTSFEDPKNPGIDIISPHWYESENLSQSDIKTADYIDKFKAYSKPVVFGEQGNAVVNWDPGSATRMRVRLWTAFFRQGILIFWNMSVKKNYTQVPPYYANIYLGEEERTYVRNLQNFSAALPLDAKPINFNINNPGVRDYGISDKTETAGYFFHFAGPGTPTSFRLNLGNAAKGELLWYDPKTGSVIRKDVCGAECAVVSPVFTTDVAFRFK